MLYKRISYGLMIGGLAAGFLALPATAEAATATCFGLTVTISGTSGPDNIVGTPGNDVISTGAGNDVVLGLAGNDTVCLGTGNDRFDGGPGADQFVADATPDGSDTVIGDFQDTVRYNARTTPVTVTLDGTANDGAPGEKDNIGNVNVAGGSAADHLTDPNSALSLQMSGGSGDDTLVGNRLLGGHGNDTLTHLSSADIGVMLGGDGNDTLTDKGAIRGTFMDGEAGADTLLGGPSGDNLLGGDGNDRLFGGNGDDSLFGDAGSDQLVGLFGNDQLSGGTGNDTLVATIERDGSDNLSGGDGIDTADYSGRNNLATRSVLNLSLDGSPNDGEAGEGDNLGADIENVKGGTGNNIITGNTGANSLQGGQSSDEIFGQDGIGGNDVIVGGFGNDFCTFDAGPPSDTVNC
jgi:Ca2+-binding RTX toxin-like protein